MRLNCKSYPMMLLVALFFTFIAGHSIAAEKAPNGNEWGPWIYIASCGTNKKCNTKYDYWYRVTPDDGENKYCLEFKSVNKSGKRSQTDGKMTVFFKNKDPLKVELPIVGAASWHTTQYTKNQPGIYLSDIPTEKSKVILANSDEKPLNAKVSVDVTDYSKLPKHVVSELKAGRSIYVSKNDFRDKRQTCEFNIADFAFPVVEKKPKWTLQTAKEFFFTNIPGSYYAYKDGAPDYNNQLKVQQTGDYVISYDDIYRGNSLPKNFDLRSIDVTSIVYTPSKKSNENAYLSFIYTQNGVRKWGSILLPRIPVEHALETTDAFTAWVGYSQGLKWQKNKNRTKMLDERYAYTLSEYSGNVEAYITLDATGGISIKTSENQHAGPRVVVSPIRKRNVSTNIENVKAVSVSEYVDNDTKRTVKCLNMNLMRPEPDGYEDFYAGDSPQRKPNPTTTIGVYCADSPYEMGKFDRVKSALESILVGSYR